MQNTDWNEVRVAIDRGMAVQSEAIRVREMLRRRYPKGHKGRRQRIEVQLAHIDKAMKPIRSYIGRTWSIDWPEDLEYDLREASRYLQYQRKCLKKMLLPS